MPTCKGQRRGYFVHVFYFYFIFIMITIIFNFLWMQQEELADIRGNNPQVFLCMVAVVITTREWFFFLFF